MGRPEAGFRAASFFAISWLMKHPETPETAETLKHLKQLVRWYKSGTLVQIWYAGTNLVRWYELAHWYAGTVVLRGTTKAQIRWYGLMTIERPGGQGK